MRVTTATPAQDRRVVAGLPFVEVLARRMAASMPHSIDIGDLVQDGVLGLIDAANRFDEARGIKNPRIWTAQRDQDMWAALQS